jgi:Mrp family chromosome partitioning ATPase
VLDEFLARRTITRGEKTYALNISFTSRSPATAAKIANAIAEAYIDDQLGAKYQTIARAGVWLQSASRDNKVIGNTSTVHNEGKSTIASNLAALMAEAGRRVVPCIPTRSWRRRDFGISSRASAKATTT